MYLPEAVLVRLLSADTGPRYELALCYLSYTLQPAAAGDAYVERILGPAPAPRSRPPVRKAKRRKATRARG